MLENRDAEIDAITADDTNDDIRRLFDQFADAIHKDIPLNATVRKLMYIAWMDGRSCAMRWASKAIEARR